MNNVYVDVLFFVNFCMDYLALHLTAGGLRTERRIRRLLLAAVLGALYAVIDVLYCQNRILSAVTGVFVSFVLCLIAFYDRRGVSLLKHFFLFWGISLLLGGAVTTLYSFLGSLFGDTTGTPKRSDLLLTLAGIAGVLITAAERFFSRNVTEKTVTVTLRHAEREATVTALCDSGNLLTDPLTGRPVVIVHRGAAKFLPDGYRFPDEGHATLQRDTALFPRPVFAEGHGGKRMLWAFSDVEISVLRKRREVTVCGIVAVDTQKERYGECDALFPASLLP